ncbi:hypothetical protein [Phocaeicola sartorii]|nr:hypothetical protein [Phocaeicola sartorii]
MTSIPKYQQEERCGHAGLWSKVNLFEETGTERPFSYLHMTTG